MNVLNMSVSASILILAVVVIRAFTLHKLPKMTFLILWGVVIFRLLVPLSISSRFSIYTGLDILRNLFSEKITLPIMMGTTTVPNMESVSTIGQSTPTEASVVSFISPMGTIWLAGMCICMLFFAVTYINFVKQFKMSLPIKNDFITLWLKENPLHRPVQIRQSDRITSPLTYGIFRPVVLLPKNIDWTDEIKLRYVLTHEYTHIRRFDVLTKMILATAICVHWFNPLVWVMYVLVNRDIELSCDERVVRSLGETIRSDYALTLIELGEKKSRITPLVNNFGRNAIEERIVSIMKVKKMSLVGAIFGLALIVGTVTVFGTNASALDNSLTIDSRDSQLVSSRGTKAIKYVQEKQNPAPRYKEFSKNNAGTSIDNYVSFDALISVSASDEDKFTVDEWNDIQSKIEKGDVQLVD